MKKYLRAIIVLVILVVIFCNNRVFAENKQIGDINADGKISLTDISILKLHLVKIKEIASEYQAYADINGDKKITITDLSKFKMQFIGLGSKELTEDELNGIKNMLKKNESILLGMLAIDSDMNYVSYNDYSILPIVMNAESVNYTFEKLFDMYTLIKEYNAGGELHAYSLESIKAIYKRIFNVNVSNEYIKQKCEEYNKTVPDDKLCYIENEKIVIVPSIFFGSPYDQFYISNSMVKDDKYEINIEFFESYNRNNFCIKTLILNKFDNNYYFESLS